MIKLLIKEYIQNMEIENRAKSTMRIYKNTLLRFNNFLMDNDIKDIEDVNKVTIKKYIGFMKNNGSSIKYINTTLKQLKSFFGYLSMEGYCANITKNIKSLKEEKKVISTFDIAYAKKISKPLGSKFIDIRNNAIIITLLETGIRANELCNIKIEDVTNLKILIRGKGSVQRYVSVSKILRKTLNKYLITRKNYLDMDFKESDFLFLSINRNKMTVDAIEKLLRKESKRRELKYYSPHMFRRFYAQQMLSVVDLYTVSRLLGHTNVKTTEIYLRGLEDIDIVESVKISPLSK